MIELWAAGKLAAVRQIMYPAVVLCFVDELLLANAGEFENHEVVHVGTVGAFAPAGGQGD